MREIGEERSHIPIQLGDGMRFMNGKYVSFYFRINVNRKMPEEKKIQNMRQLTGWQIEFISTPENSAHRI